MAEGVDVVFDFNSDNFGFTGERVGCRRGIEYRISDSGIGVHGGFGLHNNSAFEGQARGHSVAERPFTI